MEENKDKKKKIARREFMTMGATASALGIAGVASGAALFKLLFPVVSYGTPMKFKVKKSDLPDVGEEMIYPDQKVLLRRKSKDSVAAVSLVCTHLGCTVNRVTTGFQCPCHGSQYDGDGIVVGGPAPKTLPWHKITPVPGDLIEIDLGTALKEDSFFKV